MTKSNTTEISIPNDKQYTTDDAAAALAELRSELLAIDPAVLAEKPRYSVGTAIDNGFKVAHAANQDRQMFADTFKHFPMHYIDSLKTRTLALWGAQHQLTVAERLQSDDMQEMVETLRATRAQLLAHCRYGFRNDPLKLAAVEATKGGSGYRDLADDLGEMRAILENHWEEVKDEISLTEEELQRIGKLAALFWDRLQNRSDSEIQLMRDLRNRAFVYLNLAYHEVMWHGRLLYRADEPGERYPGIHKSHKPRKPSKPTQAMESPVSETLSSPPPA